MDRNIGLRIALGISTLVFVTPNAWSNRCAGRDCKEPSFSDMAPEKSTVVGPGTEFSFTASSNTNPDSIKVMVKGYEVDLNIINNGSIKVTGKLPDEITEGYARINITASSSPSSCIGNSGWLLKISPQ